MVESWVIGIMLRATSNLATVMSASSRSTLLQNSALAAQNKLLAANAARQRALRSQAYVFGGIAAGLGLAIGVGIKQAATLQQAMASVGIATETSGKQLLAFQALAMKMSNLTAQSVGTIGQEMAAAATAGLNKPAQLMSAFPEMAKAADVMWLSPKHLNPVAAVTEMTQLAHLFGSYSGPAYNHMIERATQMMFAQPEGLSKFIAQGRMFIGPALSRGVSEDDIFRQGMTMGQTGFLKGRGGSGLARIIEYLSGAATMTGHLSQAQHAAMSGLHLLGPNGRLKSTFVDSHGGLLLQKVFDYLESERRLFTPMNFGNMLTNAFLAQGGRYASTALLPSVYAKSKQNWRQLVTLGSIDSMWRTFSNTFTYGLSNFTTNAMNLLGATFLPTLPTLTFALKAAGREMGIWTDFLLKRPKIAFGVASAALGGTILFAGLAARNIWLLNSSLLALGGAARGAAIGGVAGSAKGAVASESAAASMGRIGLLAAVPDVLLAAGVVTAAAGALYLAGYGAQQLARNWSPLNNLISGTILDLQRLPGPLGNLGVNAKNAALGLGLIQQHSVLHYQYTGASNPLKDLDRLRKDSWKYHPTMGPTTSFWMDDVWKPLGATVQRALLLPPTVPQTMLNGVENWFHSFFQADPDISPAYLASQEAAYDRQNHRMHLRAREHSGQPAIHVEHLHVGVAPGATVHDAKKVAKAVWSELINHAQGHADTTGTHYPVVPHHPASAFSH